MRLLIPLLLALLLVTGCTSGSIPAASEASEPASAVSVEPSAPAGRTGVHTYSSLNYDGTPLGFTVTFPDDWYDCYTPNIHPITLDLPEEYEGTREASAVDFCYKDDMDAPMATIYLLPHATADYFATLDGPSGYGVYLGKNDRYAYYGTTGDGSPYPSGPDMELFGSLHFPSQELRERVKILELEPEEVPEND